jgi:hypothetical protein
MVTVGSLGVFCASAQVLTSAAKAAATGRSENAVWWSAIVNPLSMAGGDVAQLQD